MRSLEAAVTSAAWLLISCVCELPAPFYLQPCAVCGKLAFLLDGSWLACRWLPSGWVWILRPAL